MTPHTSLLNEDLLSCPLGHSCSLPNKCSFNHTVLQAQLSHLRMTQHGGQGLASLISTKLQKTGLNVAPCHRPTDTSHSAESLSTVC